jgi:quercetin dioxygenase-like cupin family protein
VGSPVDNLEGDVAMTQAVVEDPVLRQRFSFSRTTGADGEEVLRVEMWVEPGGGVPPHIHPAVEERFTVLEGRCGFLGGRRWSEAGPGETVVVAPGVRHAYRNRGDALTHVVCEARPPSSLQEFLEATARLSREGKLMRGGLPKPTALIEAVTIVERHREMVELLFPPMPPRFVQRLLFPMLARIGERRGL